MSPMGTSDGARPDVEPAEQLRQLMEGAPGTVVDEAPTRHTPRRVLAAVGLLVGIGAVIAVGLVGLWTAVTSQVVRAAMRSWAGY